MKENEVSYRILYIDGERIISEESVIGSNSNGETGFPPHLLSS